MKKRYIILVLLVLCLSFMSGCGEADTSPDMQTIIKECNLPMAPVPGSDYLAYDLETRNVFYLFTYRGFFSDTGYSFMSPYLGNDGNTCKYMDGTIQEIP